MKKYVEIEFNGTKERITNEFACEICSLYYNEATRMKEKGYSATAKRQREFASKLYEELEKNGYIKNEL